MPCRWTNPCTTSPTATPGPTTPTPKPTAAPAGSQPGKLNAGGVNFRSGPGTNYSSAGKLEKDTAVTVLANQVLLGENVTAFRLMLVR